MQQIIPDNYELTLSVIPLPADSNMLGIVFGGWTLQQLDLAGSVPARRTSIKRNDIVVTKAVNSVEFMAPIRIGDKVNFHTNVVKTGSSSIVVDIIVQAERYTDGAMDIVATAQIVYVRVPEIS